jgi:hypothetical protein
LNSNLEKWQKTIKVSLTIPNKIYRRFGVSNSIEYIKLIKDNIDDLSEIFEKYQINKVEETKKELKIVIDEKIEDNQISEYLDDFILKNIIYGIFQENILFGLIIVENNKKFIIDLSYPLKIDTFGHLKCRFFTIKMI